MNRKQRRAAAARQGTRVPASAPAGAPAGSAAWIADRLTAARRCHQAGQLAEAERRYREILAIDPNQIDALHLLGVVAHQAGRSDLALDLIGKAIALNGRNPAFHNNIGLAFDALARTDDAVSHYRRAITLNPDYVDAHNNLGAALLAQGKSIEAAASYSQALALRPDFAEAHNNLGNALREQGKLDEAVASYSRALALKPGFAEVHNNLGNALKQQGKLDEAVARYEQALALRPNYVEVHYNLGNAFKEQGRLDEAEARYSRALALKPDYAEAHNNLGSVLQERGRTEEAVAHLRRALAIKADFTEARNNLGAAFHAQGRLDEAVTHYALACKSDHAGAYGNLGRALMDGGDFVQALTVLQRGIEIEEREDIKLLFVHCVRNLDCVPGGIDLRRHLIRALSEPWGRPVYLAGFCARLLKHGGAARACIKRAAGAWPTRLPAQELFSQAEFAEISDDQLFRCFLTSTLVCDIVLERFLTAVRFALLETVAAEGDAHRTAGKALDFFCAVAQQCFINEYVFAHTDSEIEQAQRVRTRLAEALSSGTPIPELWLVAVAAYFPLADLPMADLILPHPWSAPVAALVVRQVQERQEERRLQASMPRLTAIAGGVSDLVKRQYEENPYPRWTKASPVGQPVTIDDYLRRRFPLHPLHHVTGQNAAGRNAARQDVVEILIAGCGTGQHSIETAQEFAGAQVLAVDLSLSSLGYAKRKTRELGLNNVEYAQADLLRLPALGRTFDLIEACGSLQCMADQYAGWRLLLSMVRPGGFMRLGLYSRTARQDINDARRLIAERGYRPCAEDIRRFRQELAGPGNDPSIRPATASEDFFSTSACRDLLFHVQEHQATLPEVKAFISENRLEFLGFEIGGHVLQHFRRRFPQDRAMIDLDLWHIFETENPLIFAGMYEFWIQKAS